jgi:hypothetical protein
MKKLFLLFGLLISVNSYGMTTYLDVDCGSWVERKDTRKIQYESYVIGLLTGMNGMWSATTQYKQNTKKFKQDVLDGVSNPTQLFLYMDKFCKQNPFKSVLEGSYSIIIELSPKN